MSVKDLMGVMEATVCNISGIVYSVIETDDETIGTCTFAIYVREKFTTK